MRANKLDFPVGVRPPGLSTVQTTPEELSNAAFLFGAFPGSRPQAVRHAIATQTPDTRYIFHTAFCCSTLLARALDLPGKCLSLKEPDILMQLANAQRMGRGEGSVTTLRQVETAFGEIGRSIEECVLVKPTNAANRLCSDMMANPSARAVVIHSDLRSFLLSIIRKGEEGRSFVRRLFNIFRMDHTFAQSLSDRDLFTLSDLQIAAFVWGMQCEQLNSAAETAGQRMKSLHCDRFLEDPEAMLREVSGWLKLGFSDEDIGASLSRGVMKHNSKDEAQAYDATVRKQDRADAVSQSLKSIEFVEDWAAKLPLPRSITIPSL
tara:strand:- start:6019 stop:6981 length:963 start_codon:yes stop_codon:yes gene_type:complete